MRFIVLAFILFATSACSQPIMDNNNTHADKGTLSYLALGDSYTIGEGVDAGSTYPAQLSASIPSLKSPDIIAQTGWTTDELIEAIAASDTKGKKYDVVTLLIGVNNQFRSYSQDVYRTEFVKLLHTAIEYAGGNKQRVFVISIPDWSVTPYAEGRDREKIAAEIAQFNTINKAEAAKEGIAYINITPSSQKAAADVSLLAKDGLHPSAKMYKLWADELAQMVKQHLNQ